MLTPIYWVGQAFQRLLKGLLSVFLAAFFVLAPSTSAFSASTLGASGCQLNSAHAKIKHVIYIQFDNTHFLQDNPNVPSDLEQMPHLLNFIKENGSLLANDHTVLISHTATGILTSLTGVYPDRMGQPVSNSFRYSHRAGRREPVSRLPTGRRHCSTQRALRARQTLRQR